MDEIAAPDNIVFSQERMTDSLRLIFDRANSADELSAYGILAGAPGLPFGTATVVQYIAAIVGSIASFLLQFPHTLQ